MNLIEQLKNYKPYNAQEEADRCAFLRFLEKNENAYSRENAEGHITVSAWIVNPDRTRVLFCYHNIYNSWSWVGGHADGNEDLLFVAIKEAREETGAAVRALSDEIFSLEILPVAGHVRKGKYVSSHVHYNVTYLVEADENEALRICEDENSAVAWIDIEEIPEKSTEKWITENIYNKITKKLHSDF